MNNTPSEAVINNKPSDPLCKNEFSLSANKPAYGEDHWEGPQGTKWYQDNNEIEYSVASTLTAVTVKQLPQNQVAKFYWVVQREECTKTDEVEIDNKYYEPQIFTVDNQIVCASEFSLEAQDPAVAYSGAGVTGYWSCNKSNFKLPATSTSNTMTVDLPYGET